MSVNPVVGITAFRRPFTTPVGDPEILHSIAEPYVEAVGEAGLIPILLPSRQSPEEAGIVLDRIDGLVVSGGGDVDPSAYGRERESVVDDDREVDRWESALLDLARQRRMPTLAICRGLQILNVTLGGTLHQDVTSPDGVHLPFKGTPEELTGRRHRVDLVEGGVLATAYGTDALEVNTLHHQGIDQLAGDLVVEATAPDGLIEAARVASGWWALGVQWHPERMPGQRRPLFEAFASQLRR